ncbi:MAG: hypothetical protein NTX92_08060 [Euryarchaeota archaeon]|nr:hypothetical protein [Euryarchaeota archaeon]
MGRADFLRIDIASISHSFLGFLLLVLAPGIVVICGEVVSIVKKKK